jgi:FtsP/CotA-like multicopper oxidase with cupredoxin domain
MLINGQVGAVATVPRSIVRLRLLNGSNARIYSLKMDDSRSMHLIATDGGFLPMPTALRELQLAPGERAEILVDFSDGRDVKLVSGPDPNQGAGGMMGRFRRLPYIFETPEFTVLPFAVDERMKAVIDKIPDTLDGDATPVKDPIANTRRFSLDMGMGPGMMGRMMDRGMMGTMAINGRSFDMGRVDLEVRRGDVERWIVQSNMLVHPFHVHGAMFKVLKENGNSPRPEHSGWKDTVLVESESELLVRLNQPASYDKPFMFHCHILEHEDAGMMGQFAVL